MHWRVNVNKPDLFQTVMKVAKNTARPKSLQALNQEDMKRIIDLCKDFEFVKANRSELSLKLTALIEEIISR